MLNVLNVLAKEGWLCAIADSIVVWYTCFIFFRHLLLLAGHHLAERPLPLVLLLLPLLQLVHLILQQGLPKLKAKTNKEKIDRGNTLTYAHLIFLLNIGYIYLSSTVPLVQVLLHLRLLPFQLGQLFLHVPQGGVLVLAVLLLNKV